MQMLITLLNQTQARQQAMHIISLEVLLKNGLSNFHSKPSTNDIFTQTELREWMSEWNDCICFYGILNMVAVLFTHRLRAFLFDSHREPVVRCIYIYICMFVCCFYGNKYTITNAEATVNQTCPKTFKYALCLNYWRFFIHFSIF